MWDFFQGPFDFNKTLLGPVGCCVLIHAKPATWQSWDFHARPGFYIGPALDSYRCFKLVKANTKIQVILDTIKFCHLYLSVPVPSGEDKIIHSLQVIERAIQGAPPPTSVSQPIAIAALQEVFESWCSLAPHSLWLNHCSAPASPRVNLRNSPEVGSPSPPSTSPMLAPSRALSPPPQAAMTSLTPLPSAPTFHATPCCFVFGNAHSPRVVSKPQQPLLPPAALVLPVREPIAHRTRSRTPAALALFASGRQYHKYSQYHIPTAKSSCSPTKTMGYVGLCTMHHMVSAETTNFAALCSALLHKDKPLALSVLEPTTGNMLEHCEPQQRDPWYKTTWDTLYANELGYLCQDIGSGEPLAPSM
jgi:hypothetical protein